MKCAEVRAALPGHVRDGEEWLELRRHLSRCSSCRAELARYEALESALGSLAHVAAEPPPGLAAALVAIVSRRRRLATLRGHVARNRSRYFRGAAVTLAGVAGAALWKVRMRRPAAA